MEQQHELRNGIVSALESSVSTTDALVSNRAPYIVYRRRDWLTFPIRRIITSGSFNPCPVTVQTIRLPSGISLNEYAASCELQHLKNPAMAAALAGSTRIPSCRASHICAATISSSGIISTAPLDSAIAT